MKLHRLETEKSVSLTLGFKADEKIELREAKIGSNLNLYGAKFDVGIGCKEANITGSVYLFDEYTENKRDDSKKATSIKGGFDAEAMIVGSRFVWKEVDGQGGNLDLRDARVNKLLDDFESWNSFGRLLFHGLTYEYLDSKITVSDRLKLLDRQRTHSSGDPFRSQPYAQLAKALAKSGDRSGATKLRYTLAKLQSRERFIEDCKKAKKSVWRFLPYIGPVTRRYLLDLPFGLFFGYGHKPTKVVWWLVVFLVSSSILYWHAFNMGEMAPNSDVILTSTEWQLALSTSANPLPQWLATETAKDYETFSSILYVIDLFLPPDLGQHAAWAPSHDRGIWGKVGYWLRTPIQLIGWVTIAVGAAVMAGLIGKSEE